MKLEEFMQQIELAYQQPTVYKKGGWGKWNGKTFEFDCVCYVKSILWGWNNQRAGHGGAKYASNGVPDIGTEKMIGVCTNVSTNFSKLNRGELVWLQGHVGIADGNGNVYEATTGWNTKKVIKSQIGKKGQRTYNKKGGSKPWIKHGYLPFVDYTDQPPIRKIVLPSRGYFMKGDRGEDITLIDQWLFERYGNKKVLGELYGNYTVKYIKDFQKVSKKNGTYDDKIDGCIGKKTLEAMRKAGFKY